MALSPAQGLKRGAQHDRHHVIFLMWHRLQRAGIDRVRRSVGRSEVLMMSSSALIFTLVGTGEARYAGDGDLARRAGLNQPFDVALDRQGNLYFSEAHNHCVRRVERGSGLITTVAGSGQAGYSGDGGLALQAQLNSPYGIALDLANNLYIVDRLNACIRMVEAATGLIRTIAGTGHPGYSGDGGPAFQAQLQEPNDIVLDGHGRAFIADVRDHRVRVVDLASRVMTTFAGTGEAGSGGDGEPASRAPLWGPRALAFSSTGDLYICLRNDHKVRKVDRQTGLIQTIAGTGEQGYTGDQGPALRATFNGPKEIAVDRHDNVILVDTENHCIRRIEAASGLVTTVAGTGQPGGDGDGGSATAAALKRPHGACLDQYGNIYIGDSENHRVRFVSVNGAEGLPW
jgi:DNA-binding beta-propeller fold protein YncE